jgi:DNA-binding transcriptional MerR regulator
MSTQLFIGKVAKAAGVSVQAVRYYERLGLLPPSQRTESGYRVYPPEISERLRFIRQAQAVGLRLEEIREILRIKYVGKSPCNCVRVMLEKKLKKLEEQLAALANFREQLRRTLHRARNLPRLPHRASAICPLIEDMPAVRQKGGEKR